MDGIKIRSGHTHWVKAIRGEDAYPIKAIKFNVPLSVDNIMSCFNSTKGTTISPRKQTCCAGRVSNCLSEAVLERAPNPSV